jgi:hypothetical protein
MTRIEVERSLCEARVIELTRCMLTAIAHCNSLGVAHRYILHEMRAHPHVRRC